MWDDYPTTYRQVEASRIARCARAGESANVVGLSGSGKSNLLGFVAHRLAVPGARLVLLDCNRLREPTPDALLGLMARSVGGQGADPETAIAAFLSADPAARLCLLMDRFDALGTAGMPALFSNLRALRDAHKYRLSFVAATRRPLDPRNEFSELVYANTIWLGCLSAADAGWNVARYAARRELTWGDGVADALIGLTRGYPAFLRAACEAHADLAGEAVDADAIARHPAMQARLAEFWSDQPAEAELERSGLAGLPLLLAARTAQPARLDTTRLTAKEVLLLNYLQSRPGEVCEKDDIIRAVWSEDKAYIDGIRDDSLAQLVRRLREKIELDPGVPRHVLTVPGRGYRFVGGPE